MSAPDGKGPKMSAMEEAENCKTACGIEETEEY
jgi:hypothetical protein